MLEVGSDDGAGLYGLIVALIIDSRAKAGEGICGAREQLLLR